MQCSEQINIFLQDAGEAMNASKELQFSSIDFDWGNMQFNASSESSGGQAGVIRLSATIGRLYYTIEDERLRKESIKQLHRNNRFVDGRFKLEKNGTVTFSSLTTSDSQLTGKELVQALTIIMLESSEQFKGLRAYLKAA